MTAESPAPQRLLQGRLRLPSLEGPVEIHTDSQGVPHIDAGSRADLYRAQGFLHYADRSWQIDVNTRTALGKLSAILGPGGLPSDVLFRRLGVPELAGRCAAEADTEVRAVFGWYADGMRDAHALVPTTHEHVTLGVSRTPPDAWGAHRDAVAISLLMGFTLQRDWVLGLVREALTGDAGRATDGPGAAEILDALSAPLAPLGRAVPQSAGGGSNAWAVPRQSEAGPLVAGDPHLDARVPGHFMAMHLTCPEIDVIGATIPGLPDVAFGHNGAVAWATTFAPVLETSLVLERLSCRRTRAARPGSDEHVRRTTAAIEVRGLGTEMITCESTTHGRLLGLDIRGTEPDVRYDLAFRSTQWEAPYDQRALAEANRATTLEELAQALRRWRSLPQTVVCADTSGRTGRVSIGSRRRAAGEESLLLGWSAIPPFVTEPRHHAAFGHETVVSANHDPAPVGNGDPEPGHWEAPLRADRIAGLLGEGDPSVAWSVRAQLDLASPLAEMLLPDLLACMAGSSATSVTDAAARLADWNRECYRDASEAAVFAAWMVEVARAAAASSGAGDLFVSTKAWLTDWGLAFVRRWLRDQVEDPGGRREVVTALKRALANLTARGVSGGSRDLPHRPELVYRHHLVGTPFDSKEIRVGGGAQPGAEDTVCRGDVLDPSAVTPAWRMVVDLGDPDCSVWSFPVGNSGVPDSAHFADRVADWARGGHAWMAFSRSAVAALGGLVQRLAPEPGSLTDPPVTA